VSSRTGKKGLMKLLVFAHRLEIGGSQHNAIELTATLRDRRGVDPVIFAEPGPAARLAHERGLRLIDAPAARAHPSPARGRALRAAIRREQPDVVHIWDWPQCLDAYYAVHVPWRTPLVVSVMDMNVPRLLPRSLPTTFGYPELVEQARRLGRRDVALLLPPVDVERNRPEAVAPAEVEAFRSEHGLAGDGITIVQVGRLVRWLKGESLRRSVAAVRQLGRELPLQLVLVGDGDAREEVQRLADDVNTELGRRAIVLTGALVDPRPAYAAADLVVGMGTSALRGMAFAKPVIVVGEGGFANRFDEDSAAWFLHHGIFGRGAGDGGDPLVGHLRRVVAEPGRWPELGALGRRFVVEHFGLEVGAAHLMDAFAAAQRRRAPLLPVLADGARSAVFNLVRVVRDSPAAQSGVAARVLQRRPGESAPAGTRAGERA
jgi:glycosyltransferase involved in cell wall biosynthesis